MIGPRGQFHATAPPHYQIIGITAETHQNRKRATSTPALVDIASHRALILAVPGRAHTAAGCMNRSGITVDNRIPSHQGPSLQTKAKLGSQKGVCMYSFLLEERQIGNGCIHQPSLSETGVQYGGVWCVLQRAGSRRA